MKRRFKSIFDSWITSTMGVILYVITTMFIWKGTFSFVWEGIAGYAVGTTLLLFPKSIETFIVEWLRSKTIRYDNSAKPDTPNGE